MKKIIIALCAIVTCIITGCKSLPTSDTMYKLGASVGYTTAYVLNNQVKVDNKTRQTIIDVVNIVENVIPATNETFASIWTPKVKELTDKYVAEGSLTQAQADRVVKDFNYIITLLDNYIEKKGIRGEQELVEAFVHGFCGKFLASFKPANYVGFSTSSEPLDEYTYNYLTSNLK